MFNVDSSSILSISSICSMQPGPPPFKGGQGRVSQKPQIMNKIFTFLANIPSDKYAHALVSLIILSVLAALIRLCTATDDFRNVLVATVLTFVIGVSKETYDSFHEDHDADPDDLLADIIGIALGIILIYLNKLT